MLINSHGSLNETILKFHVTYAAHEFYF